MTIKEGAPNIPFLKASSVLFFNSSLILKFSISPKKVLGFMLRLINNFSTIPIIYFQGPGVSFSIAEKISKSLGNVIDPNEIIKAYGIDTLRFFLLREVPFGNDGDFSKKSLQRRMNDDLANDLGNLVQRVLTIINKNLDGKLSKIKQIKENDKKIYAYPEELLKNIEKNYEKQEFHKVIENIWKLISKANKYVDESAPWQLIKDDRERAGDVLNILVIIIAKIAIFLAPIMPDISENILNKIGLSIKNLTMEDISKNNFLNIDHIIKKPEIIFHKIDNE